ncbi:MAG TPA: serine/threonine-protein kinase, partial [Polyangiaceae bacterium]
MFETLNSKKAHEKKLGVAHSELGVSIDFPVTVFILPPTMSDPLASSEPSGPDAVEVVGRGRYAVTGMLGEGSQGETLEAVDKRDGRLVAIKRFRIKGAASWKDVELAEREAHVLSGLEHPSLPRYIEHFEESGVLYLVMDRLTGKSLGGFQKRGPLDQHAVVQLLNDMADVLDYLHLRAPPIIHRDIKPGNIIRRPDGAFALVDFGSVRDRLKPEGGSTVVGTFGYMAPEQFQGRALPVSDVYGVGATALALLTGRDPDALPHQGLGLDVARALSGQVDARLVHVLSAMLRPDPDQRAPRLS